MRVVFRREGRSGIITGRCRFATCSFCRSTVVVRGRWVLGERIAMKRSFSGEGRVRKGVGRIKEYL